MEITTQNHLRSLDKNADGLTVKELRAFDKDGDNSLSTNELGKSDISKSDLLQINLKFGMGQTMAKVSLFAENLPVYSRSELNSELFPGGLTGISETDIVQGGLNDCFFLSTIAGIAKQRPYDIVKMIKENSDGTFTVNFPGASKSITIEKPTSKELADFAHKGENGSTWVAVVEKAFAKYSNTVTLFPKTDSRNKIDHGGLLSPVMATLTGKIPNISILNITPNFILKMQLKSTLENNRIVTASTFMDGNKNNNLIKDHVYSVLSFDDKTNTVRIRNPWGSGSDAKNIKNPDSKNDGTFTLTLKEFHEYFSLVCFETHVKKDFSNILSSNK